MFPTNSERLISISDAFSAFVYGYLSSCPHAHCTPNKSVPTLRYTHRHGPVYTGYASRHVPSAVPWISEDRLFKDGKIWTNWSCLQSFVLPSISHFILFCRWFSLKIFYLWTPLKLLCYHLLTLTLQVTNLSCTNCRLLLLHKMWCIIYI